MSLSFPFLTLLTLLSGVFCNEFRIHNASELISFSNNVNNVNNGKIFFGTTVFLDSDIVFTDELSQQFEPIGNYNIKYFYGTFDGQGHTISNLLLNSSSQDNGLFGTLLGAAIIKNVVMDSSCSITSHHTDDKSHAIGGIIGSCYSIHGSCVIENSVNMGNIVFDGNATKNFFMGGIIGNLHTEKHNGIITNCANYGSIMNFGLVENYSGFLAWNVIGGIVGYSNGLKKIDIYIYNCLNYGSIRYIQTSVCEKNFGGIVGYSIYSAIENCVSTGEILFSGTSEHSYIGVITGHTSSDTNVTHCFWTNEVGSYAVSGTGTPTVTNSAKVELDITTINELNEYTEKNSTWNKWVMLYPNGGSIGNISKKFIIGLENAIQPLHREGETFICWCTDSACSDQYDPQTTNISEVNSLYAYWSDSYIATFNLTNGTVFSVIFALNDTITYPDELKKEGYTFSGWVPSLERMPAENVTIEAQWKITISSEYVEILFTKRDMTEEDAKEIIRKYTDEYFKIEKFEFDKDTNKFIVVIKFDDSEKANDFIINTNKNKGDDDLIESVTPITVYNISFSFSVHLLYYYIIILISNLFLF